MTKELVRKYVDLQALLLDLAQEEEGESPPKLTSKQERIARWRGSRETIPIEYLTELVKRTRRFIQTKFARISLQEDRKLTAEEATQLMDEFLDSRLLEEALLGRREDTKRMVFAHLTLDNIDKNIEDPDNHNGSIEVPDFNKKFVREGTGRTPPRLNHRKLEQLLDATDWRRVTDLKTIPAQTEIILDEQKLLDLIDERPEIMERVRLALELGEIKTPRFQVRDM